MPKKQTKKEFAEETLSSVKKEMAKPRETQSVREKFSQLAREVAHLEQKADLERCNSRSRLKEKNEYPTNA